MFLFVFSVLAIFDCSELDPDTLREIKSASATLTQAANSATDAVTEIASFIKNKLNKSDAEIQKFFGVPAELDYI